MIVKDCDPFLFNFSHVLLSFGVGIGKKGLVVILLI
jgi:hypothetical protein